MLNKKLLAVAITAAMSQGIANAAHLQDAVDLDGNPLAGTVKYSKELTWGQSTAIIENANGDTPSHLTADIGFTIAEGTNKYIRIDLGQGATFESTPRLKWDTVINQTTGVALRGPDENNTGDVDSDPRAQTYTGSPNPQSSISEGGIGESYVIFEVNAFEADNDANEDIPSFLSFYVEVDKYSVSTEECTTARYRLFEDAVDAQRENNNETLKDTGENVEIMCFEEAIQNNFTIPNNAYASVDSEYTVFIHADSEFADHDETNYYDEQQNGNDGNNNGGFDGVGTWAGAAVSATTASLGEVDADLLLVKADGTAVTGFRNLDGGVLDIVDVIGNDPVVTFNGDFSFGEWTMREVTTVNPGDSCSVGTDIVPDATSTNKTLVFSQLTQTDIETKDYVLCVDVAGMTSDVEDNLIVGMENPWENGNRIGESSYKATLSWDEITSGAQITDGDGWNELLGSMPRVRTDEMGEIIYDTITVDIPFMSLFEDYKQRFHLTNTGPTNATYMFEFIPENGTTVTPGPAATGVIPAGTTIVIQTSAIIASFDGNTRTAAQVHLGGEDEDMSVSSVIVNREKGTIDNTVLNANSIKARKSNFLPEANNTGN